MRGLEEGERMRGREDERMRGGEEERMKGGGEEEVSTTCTVESP